MVNECGNTERSKTKQMVITTMQGREFKLLGARLGEDLKWTEHVNEVTSSCYKLMAPTRKVKNIKAAEQGRQGDLVGSSETTTVICVLSIDVKL